MVKYSLKGQLNVQFHTVYDNAGSGTSAGTGTAGASGGDTGGDGGNAGGTGSDGGNTPRTYSETEYQAAVTKERQRLEQSNRKTVLEFKQLQQSSATTEEEKIRLSTRIKELEEEFLSKEELAKRAKEQSEKELTGKYNQASEEAKAWRSRFENQLKETAITSAAIKAGAKRPEIFMNLLRDNVNVIEITDSVTGKPTGQFEVKVKHSKREGDEVKELVLRPEDAFKLMVEDTENFGFLFNGDKSPGLGGNSGKPDAPIDVTKLTPEQYRTLRKSGKLGF